MQKKKVFGFILMLIAILTVSLGGKTTHAAEIPKLMEREGSAYISGKGYVYYAIGASRSGNTKYTADLIKTITFVSNKNVPATAEASWDASYANGDMEVIAWVAPNATDATKYDLYIGTNSTNIEAPANSLRLFANYTNCVSINNLKNLTTKNVTSMNNMFSSCTSLTALDLSSFDTSDVTNMLSLFESNSALKEIKGIENFNTSKVTDMRSMFNGCTSLTSLNLSKFDTTSADMSYMLLSATSLKTILLGPKFNKFNGGGIFNKNNSLMTIFAQSKEAFSNFESDSYYFGTTSTHLHVPNSSESLYEADSNILNKFGSNRIRPVLELIGDSVANVGLGNTYVDAGATVGGFDKANENYYTQYGYKLTSTSDVDTSKVGSYTVTYTLTYPVDGEANLRTETITRTVIVSKAVLMAPTSGNILGSSFSKSTVTKMVILNSFDNAPTSYIENGKWDVSADEAKGSVYAYLTLNADGSTHTLYIVAGSTIKVTVGCDLFSNFPKLTSIEGMEYLNTSTVTDMSWMFSGSSSLTNIDISMLDTSSAINMEAMFADCSSVTNINMKGIDTSKVKYMGKSRTYARGMFDGCTKLKSVDMANLNTASLLSTNSMFKDCEALVSIDLSGFNTSNVNDMVSMFNGCPNLKSIILDNKITSSDQAMKLLTGTNLDTLPNAILYVPDTASEKLYETAENYSTIFADSRDTTDNLYRIRPILEITGDNPVNIKQGQTYDATTDAGITIAGFGKSNASEYTKYGYNYVVTGLPVDTTTDGTKQITYTLTKTQNGVTTNGMIATRNIKVQVISKLMEREASEYDSSSSSYIYYAIGAKRSGNNKYTADLINTTSFVSNTNIPNTAEASWDVSYNNGDMQILAWVIPSTVESGKYDLYIGTNDTVIQAPENAGAMFSNYTNLTAINGLTMLDTSVVTNMRDMFWNCYKLTSVDLSNFKTSNVQSFAVMFMSCLKLTNIDVSGFDTSSATDMSMMFYNCDALTNLNVTNFDTSKVTNMQLMFWNCNNLTTLDLSNFNTSKVTNMDNMFYNDTGMKILLLGNNFDRLIGSSMFNNTTMSIVTTRTSPLTINSTTGLSSLDNVVLYVNNTTVENTFENDTSCMTEFGSNRIRPILEFVNGPEIDLLIGQTYNNNLVTVAGRESAVYTSIGYTVEKVEDNVDLTNSGTYNVTYRVLRNGTEIMRATQVVNVLTGNYCNVTTGRYYETLQSAINASNNGEVIRVMESVADASTSEINVSKEITIDTNGKTVTLPYRINNNSTLKIIGKGTMNFATGAGLINYSTMIIEEATINNVSGTEVVKNSAGTLTINSGNIIADTESAIFNNGATVIVNGGTITSNAKVTINNYGGIVTINAGNITTNTSDQGLINNWNNGTTNINGGKLSIGNTSSAITVSDGKLNISGGEISNTGTGIAIWNVGETTMTGGKIISTQRACIYTASNATVTLGTKDGNVSRETPMLISPNYTIHSDGTFNFYDGILKNNDNSAVYYGTPNTEVNYKVYTHKSKDADGYYLAYPIYANPMISEGTYQDIFVNKHIFKNSSTNRDTVLTITLHDEIPSTLPDGAWDISDNNSQSVYAWLTTSTKDSTKYDLHLATDGIMYASSAYGLFGGYANCTNIYGLEYLNTSYATDFSSMFRADTSLQQLDLSSFDTSNSTYMYRMFYGDTKLTSLNISNFNTSKVTSMEDMFYNCSSLTELNVQNFDASKVTNMYRTFYNCSSLTSLDLSEFNTASLTQMSNMFSGCSNILSINLSGIDTTKVTSMENMFYNCNKLKSLNLSSFNTSNVKTMREMFSNCGSLKSIYLSDGFNTASVTDMYGIFMGCTNLTALILDKKITSSDQAVKLLTGGSDVRTYLEDLSDIILYVPDAESEKLYETATNYSTIFENDKDSEGDLYRIRPIFEMRGENPVNIKVRSVYDLTTDAGVTIAGFDKTNATEYTQYGFDYTVSGLPVNTDTAGTKKVTYTLTETKNGTTTNRNTLTRNIVVSKKSVTDLSITLDGTNKVYTGAKITPKVTVKEGNTILVESKDYTLVYDNNINVGTATVKITGCGDYDREVVLNFNITPADITGGISITGSSKYGERLYANIENINPANVTLEYKWYINSTNSTTGGTIILGENDNNYLITKGKVGKYIYVEVTAKSENYNTKVFKAVAGPVQAINVNELNVILLQDVFIYDGQAKKPGITLTNEKTQEKLILGTDYTVEYADNIEVGTATLKVTGINDYTGEREVKFSIIKLPTIKLTNLATGWTNDDVNVEISVTEGGAGIKKVLFADKEVTLNDNNKATEIVASNGLYKCQVYDIYGNIATAEIYIDNIDKKAPEITSVVYDKDTYAKNVNIEVKATDTDSGILSYCISTISAEPISWTDITPVENVSIFNISITGNGTYYLYVKDVAGNITKYNKQIVVGNVDGSAPVIKLFNITEDYTFTREIFIQIKAEDDTGVESILLSDRSLTNSQVENSTSWIPYTETVLYTLPSQDGTYTLYVWVKDTVGNISKYAQDSTLLLSKYIGGNGKNSTSFKFLVKDENYDFNKKVTPQNIKLEVKDNSGNITYSTDYGVQITSISLPVVYGPTQEGTQLMSGEYYIVTVENIQGNGTVYLIFDTNTISDKAGNKLSNAEIETDVMVELNAPTITLGTTEIQVSDAENNLIQAIKINGKTVLLTNGKISYTKLQTDYGITLKTGDKIEAFDKYANTVTVTTK